MSGPVRAATKRELMMRAHERPASTAARSLSPAVSELLHYPVLSLLEWPAHRVR